jgi:FtsP/CotA-like multicopper oxidase with cupredoxin domain
VPAFGESGHRAQIPGPLLRMPEGTTLRVKVTNHLEKKATLFGFNTRPGDPKAGIELAPAETRELSFAAGAPGTYYYWARTSEPFKTRSGKIIDQPLFADGQLNGAFVVDPPGSVPADRIFVIDTMFVRADVLQPDFEVVTINGKSYPYTEPLEYIAGETIRWRVLNPSVSEHPMHLHGAFYQLLSLGDFESDTPSPAADRQSVVTENLLRGHTMMLEWKPEHEGRWLFHCHFQGHVSNEVRLPKVVQFVAAPPAESAAHDQAMGAMPMSPTATGETGMNETGMSGSGMKMTDMAGLVLAINVKPSPTSAPPSTAAPHKLDLVIEPSAASGKSPTFTCSVREGKKLVASEDKTVGPPIIVTRGEPTEITVVNHLKNQTTIHWHGIELDSYYDGVMGGGIGHQMTPAIAPGGSFTAHFTPNRAGTFIYHTHAADPDQLSGGIFGALIVLDPGQTFDPEHDKLLVLGSRDPDFTAKRLTLNGAEAPSPMQLQHGVKYRLRLIDMGANLAADFQLGSKEHPATWLALAKDGAKLPARLATASDASLHIASGETYDFEFQSDTPGEIPLHFENTLSKGKLEGKIVVQ